MGKKGKIDISYLILNYNGNDLLKIILRSIKRQAFDGSIEVVVVDNNSSDGSLDFLKQAHPYVKVVVNKENLGTSGINSGLEHCMGKYIFYLNNDIELDEDCLKRLYIMLEKDPSIGLAVPKFINFYNRKVRSGGFWLSRSFYGGHYLEEGQEKGTIEVPYAGVFLFRKEIAKKAGYLFDPDYFIYSEDVDFSLRARLMGYRIMMDRSALLYHMHAATIGKQKKNKSLYYLERNLLSTFIKVASVRSVLWLLPYVLGMRALAILKDAMTLEWRNAYLRMSAIGWVVLHLPLILKKRGKVQLLRKVGDEVLFGLCTENRLLRSRPLPL